MSRASLIYLTYNSADEIGNLPVLATAAGEDLPVVSIDNCSTDDSVERLQEIDLDPHVLDANLGFTAGINLGLRHLLDETDVEWAIIANPDVAPFERDWLTKLLDVPDECGIVGGRLVSGLEALGGGYLLDNEAPLARDLPHPVEGGTIHCREMLGWSRVTQRVGDTHAFTEPRDVAWVAFALCALRMEAVRDIGMLDAAYWHYVSDHEYGLRAWAHGWAVRFQPVSFWHVGGASRVDACAETAERARDDIRRWCRVEPEYLRASRW